MFTHFEYDELAMIETDLLEDGRHQQAHFGATRLKKVNCQGRALIKNGSIPRLLELLAYSVYLSGCLSRLYFGRRMRY